MRALPVFLAVAIFAAPAMADTSLAGGPITVEDNTYRFGDLYRSERGTTIEACAKMCTADSACASWSLVPATFRMGPRCELKQTPGEAVSRPGAVSGMSEFWQMDPVRHTPMRYQPSVPASRQPAAVPLEQLRPSPVPRVFGDPPPVRQPELMGAPTPSPQVELAAPAPTKVKTITSAQGEVLRGPGEGQVPGYVKQPAPKAPAQPVYKDPARENAPAQPISAPLNAVVKRQSQAPLEIAAPEPQPDLAPARTPWTERTGDTPNYSVGGSGYVPGDEDATAGFVEGLPEAGT